MLRYLRTTFSLKNTSFSLSRFEICKNLWQQGVQSIKWEVMYNMKLTGGGSQPYQIQIYRPVENSTILRKKSVITMYIKKTSEDEKFTL